jgi:hypothetical protein
MDRHEKKQAEESRYAAAKAKSERIEENIKSIIARMTKGPYYVNRAMKRDHMSFKKERYVMTDEDRKRLEAQRNAS